MEYRIESAGHLTNEEILRAVDAFLNPGSGLSPGFYPHSGRQIYPTDAMLNLNDFLEILHKAVRRLRGEPAES